MREVEVLKIELTPIPPDTIGTVRAELVPLIESALMTRFDSDVVEQVVVDIEETFPTSEVVDALVTLGSGMTIAIFKEVVIPILRERFVVRTRSEKKGAGHQEEE